MSLQELLETNFSQWQPPEPEVKSRTKYSVTLDWSNIQPFEFIADRLLYRLEKDNKIPPWIVVYRYCSLYCAILKYIFCNIISCK